MASKIKASTRVGVMKQLAIAKPRRAPGKRQHRLRPPAGRSRTVACMLLGRPGQVVDAGRRHAGLASYISRRRHGSDLTYLAGEELRSPGRSPSWCRQGRKLKADDVVIIDHASSATETSIVAAARAASHGTNGGSEMHGERRAQARRRCARP